MYYTDSHLNGDIYRVGDDGDIEDIVGKFENSYFLLIIYI